MVKLRCRILNNNPKEPFMSIVNTLSLESNRQIKINFDGGDLSSDAGLLNDLQSKAIQLIEEIHTNRFCKDEKINLCVRDLILSINRNIYELENPNREKEEKTLYQNIVDYIEQHIHEALSLNTLSEQFYVSKYHISHVFKAQIGLSVHQYILKKRLYICKSALLQGTNISTAYLQCGFNDYSSFFKAFKKEFGLSPKEYVLNYSVSSNQNFTFLEGLGTISDVCVSHNNVFIDNSSNKD